jgi:hypothetical protein
MEDSMNTYRVDMAFYVEAETADGAKLEVENGMSAKLAADYDWIDTNYITTIPEKGNK